MTMSRYYDMEGNPIPGGALEWAKMFEDTENRRVGRDEPARGIVVSTVWLGLDHRWGYGPPLIYETMIFGGRFEDDEYQVRYSTREEALAGHKHAVRIAWTFRDKLVDALKGFIPTFPIP